MLKTLFDDIINNKRNRLAWIDYARGIAIVLVLYRHVFEGIKQSGIDIQHFMGLEHANIIFFSFRMPLFFIVSGVFMGGSLLKRGLNEFILNKCKIILYPYALWAAIQITLQLIFSQYVNGGREWTDYLYILYSPREIEQFWYLYALFNVTVLYAIVKVNLKLTPVQQLGLGLLLFYLSSWLVQHKIGVYFLYDVLHFYIFFALGDLLSGIMKNPIQCQLFRILEDFFPADSHFCRDAVLFPGHQYQARICNVFLCGRLSTLRVCIHCAGRLCLHDQYLQYSATV